MRIINKPGTSHSDGLVELTSVDCRALMHSLDVTHSNGDPSWYQGPWKGKSDAARLRVTLENLLKNL